jgi:starvation-inducible DNA-binding protein
MANKNTARVTRMQDRSARATMEPTARFQTRIDISDESKAQLIELLNARLADSMDLYSQAKFAHWNVKGKDFYQVHLLFDAVAEHVEEGIDLIAERITALGGRANGTLRQAAESSSIGEYQIEALTSMEHVNALAEQVAKVGNAAREAIDQCDELDDQASADLFTEIVRQLDKDLYFLESHIQI